MTPRAEIQLTVDVAVFTIRDGALQVLLVRRGVEPFEGSWATPGGFVLHDEPLHEAARRELFEETGADQSYLEQLYTFGAPDRDPRGRVVTVAYYALVAPDRLDVHAGSDAAQARWFDVTDLPPLAFDHATILAYALERLRAKVEYSTIAFELLPEKFTLSELQGVYESILGHPLDKRNFRRKLKLLDVLVAHDEWEKKGASRPARLYSFQARQPSGP
jgi:8-oxo-dGTP diphosphatase